MIPERRPCRTRESAVVLDTALKLRAELHAQGFETMMTRVGDAYKTPIERTDLSNSRNADLFVSLHANSFTSAAANGTETYCLSPGGQGEKLAGAVQLRLIEAVALKNRGTKTASFYVLRKTKAPAILCELAFISNAGEEKLLASNEYRTAWGRAICLGICDYYGILYDGGSVSGGETAFEPYRVRVTEPVRVYLEPRGLKEVLQISSGVYTVIDKDGSYGKLKSGAGWIFLRDVERL